jgi:hypothetical protein
LRGSCKDFSRAFQENPPARDLSIVAITGLEGLKMGILIIFYK